MTVVLQESAVAYAFVREALPLLEEKGVDALVYYVASAELFDLLPEEERRAIFPAERAAEAVGITGFTLPTLYRWVTSEAGRDASLYPFRERPLSRQRPGRGGAGRGRPRRRRPGRRHPALRRGPPAVTAAAAAGRLDGPLRLGSDLPVLPGATTRAHEEDP